MLFSVGGDLLGSTGRCTGNPLEVVVEELPHEGLGAEKWPFVRASRMEKLGCVMRDEGDHDCAYGGNVQRYTGSVKELKIFDDCSDEFWI